MAAEIGVPIWFKLLSCEDPSWRSKYHFAPEDPVLATPDWVWQIYPPWSARSIQEKPLHPALPGVCVLPFSFMVINWNGDAFPCDVVYGERFRLGNLVRQSLDDVWFGREYVKCRSFLRHYGPPQASGSVCQDNPCPVAQKWLA
jgi:radical SAM protein with 4Fe4S-binding SPASM domain